MTRVARVAAVGLLLAMMLFGAAGVAAAHAVLIATDPAKDAELATGPDEVSATFNESLQPTFAAMTVVGPDHHLWQSGHPRVQGAIASIKVRPLGPVGVYTVHYRVTSADGHPVSGAWSFRLTVPGTGQPGPAVSEPGPAPAGGSGRQIPIWPFAVGAIVIVGAGLWAAQRRS
ncbi:Copper transport protein YcnJ [Mycobacterium talmoniae]|uniref:Copper transport protein YcnJ n=2 Tax=Mycobacterium talmoniae TaxID=1858794 RepID=A0A2S8BC02_9MYCO|nr:copper resistance CopC family protein [Mycobacterium eburneum]PQM44173.1 Copper transport protein YcnJ [Mycobacterium talmoniae]TDH47525.1 copper resistance protein CopC [Mycobacterium eburneum]